MSTFNVYGGMKNTYGGSHPVWANIRQKERIGGKFATLPPIGVIRAGSLVSLSNGVATLVKTFQVEATTASDATVVTVYNHPSHCVPVVGEVVMAAPATATTTGKAVTISAVSEDKPNGIYSVTLSATLGVLAKDSILVLANGAGASGKTIIAVPTGFSENDVQIDATSEYATINSVYDGELLELRVQAIPDFVRVILPQIKFTKGI